MQVLVPEMRENKNGEGDGEEGYAVPHYLHHPGEVQDKHLPFYIRI